jgi:DNA-binding NarL/FixJ family response regulator
MDVRMPNVDGIEATRRIIDGTPNAPRVLVLTTFDLDEVVFEAIRVGASRFLLKTSPADQLVHGVASRTRRSHMSSSSSRPR